jgi:hypothetical protein
MDVGLAQVRGWSVELEALGERIAPRFGRIEVRRRAGAVVRGLLAGMERKNGSSVVKAAVVGHVAAVCCDRCWSATRYR